MRVPAVLVAFSAHRSHRSNSARVSVARRAQNGRAMTGDTQFCGLPSYERVNLRAAALPDFRTFFRSRRLTAWASVSITSSAPTGSSWDGVPIRPETFGASPCTERFGVRAATENRVARNRRSAGQPPSHLVAGNPCSGLGLPMANASGQA